MHATGCAEDGPNMVIAGDNVLLQPDGNWNEEPEDLDIADLPPAIRAIVSPAFPNFRCILSSFRLLTLCSRLV